MQQNRVHVRMLIIAGVALLWITAIFGRLSYLQLFRHSEYLARAQRQQQRTIEITPKRGAIFDRNMRPLAMSIPVDSAFVVPAASQNPRLRFWQWYSLAGGAGYPYNDDGTYGYVEVLGTNGWQTVSPRYVNTSGVWTEPSIDLSAYAGQSIQVAFHFHSTHNTAAGWFVDNVTLVTGAITTLTPNVPVGFEGGLGDWYVDDGNWQVGVPTNPSGPGPSRSSSRRTGSRVRSARCTGRSGGTAAARRRIRFESPRADAPSP
jgi:hypothetical protein